MAPQKRKRPSPSASEEDLRPGKADLRPGKADLRPGKADLRPGKEDLRPGKEDLRPGKADLRPDEDQPGPGAVLCDFCCGSKLKALKSCLVCLSSFCEIHLQPHLTVSGLRRHQLTEPVDDLEDRVCPEHQRPLELFCGTDRTCVCSTCVLLEHKNHEYVSVEDAFETEKDSLQQNVAQNQLMVEQRRLKVQEIQRRLDLSETEKDGEAAAGLRAFTVLTQSVQRSLDHFLERLQEKHRNDRRRAQELQQQLQQEICELEKSSAEARRLSLSTDALRFLRRRPAPPPAALEDRSGLSFEPETCEGSAARALADVVNGLSEELRESEDVRSVFRDELRRVRSFAVDLTFDPDSAHPKLVLSEDLRRVHHSDQRRALSDGPARFSRCCCVVAKQSFCSGRFYFEVSVEGKSEWDVGVVRESVDRKGKIALKPGNGQWVVWLRGGREYRALAGRPLVLTPRAPPRTVAVFVDYEAGLVSFFDADSADPIFSFTDCVFEEPLLPYFSPCNNDRGRNSAPLELAAARRVKAEPQDAHA